MGQFIGVKLKITNSKVRDSIVNKMGINMLAIGMKVSHMEMALNSLQMEIFMRVHII